MNETFPVSILRAKLLPMRHINVKWNHEELCFLLFSMNAVFIITFQRARKMDMRWVDISDSLI